VNVSKQLNISVFKRRGGLSVFRACLAGYEREYLHPWINFNKNTWVLLYNTADRLIGLNGLDLFRSFWGNAKKNFNKEIKKWAAGLFSSSKIH